MFNLGSIKKGAGDFLYPIMLVVVIFLIWKFANSALKSWKLRNVGLSAGALDFSNFATDIYNTYGIGYSREEVDSLAARILALSNEQIYDLNDKFVGLYGDQCKGGGWLCNDTTNIKSYISPVWCFYGCKNQEALVSRLTALGL